MAKVDVQVRMVGLEGPHENLEMQVTGPEGHVFRASSWWVTSRESAFEELHEVYSFRCFCGFFNTQIIGYYQLDALHAALLLVGVQAAYERGLDHPEGLEYLEGIAFQAFERIDEGLAKTRAFLRKQSGAPTASQLREMLGR